MAVWEKYNKLEECNEQDNDNFKTYRVQRDYFIKEIPFQTDEDKLSILGKIDIIKNEIKIYDIIEEQFCIYVVIGCENDQINKFNDIYNNNGFKCESIIKGQPSYSNLSEIQKLYKKGESKIVKIDIKYNNQRIRGTGFFLEINSNLNLPFTKALITCNHVLNEKFLINNDDIDLKFKNKNICLNIKDSQIFTIENYKIEKENAKRRIFTDPDLDFTCIELLKNDFKGEYELFKTKEKSNEAKNKEIFILHYPPDNDLSFSIGKILAVQNYNIGHNASTEGGSSGCPIITRDDLNAIGIHKGGDNIKNVGYFIEDIMERIKNIFSNIIPIKQIIDKLSSENIKVNSNSYKYLKKTLLKEGNIGAIFEAINQNKEKILVVEINIIKLFISKSGKNFLDEIKNLIEIIKQYNDNNILDIFLEGNSLKIALFKYEQHFIEYFNNNKKELKDYEVYAIIKQFFEELKKKDFILFNFTPDSILIENINTMKFRFINSYNYIVGIIKSDNLFKPPKDLNYSQVKNWSIGLLLYFLTMKGKDPFNLKNSEDIIQNIKNGKEIPINKSNIFYYDIINSLKNYRLPRFDNKIKVQLNQYLMTKEDKNFCIKNQGSICHLKFGNIQLTGFFCKIEHKSIPFKRTLIIYDFGYKTKSIIINYLKNNKMIEKTINMDKRKNIIKEEILFIELFENDDIENFFELDEKNLKETYESKDIILLQYEVNIDLKPLVKDFSFSSGKINEYADIYIYYESQTLEGAMGSPIILRNNNNYYLIGIHKGCNSKLTKNKIGLNLYSLLKNI